ncbi:hypothetical protein GmHk_03G007770 [Glycine max]|nr:hypothetical protein GmHk_03G007770 [Glycine max]
MNPTVSITTTLIVEIKTFMKYTPSYKKTWLAKQRALVMIHGNGKESYVKAAKSCGSFAILCSRDCVLKHVFRSFGPCINGFAYCKPIQQVDVLYENYIDTLLIATTQDDGNHIFSIAYTIVEGETTSAHPSIISAYNNPSNLWVGDTSHLFYLCHITQNFLRGNSNGKHSKKPLMLHIHEEDALATS